jgi:flagellar biosynthesis/type III secretory pathway protein FliH
MPDEFVPFEVFLRNATMDTRSESVDDAPISVEETAAVEATADEYVGEEVAGEMREAISEVRRFRAALADALDLALERVLHDIAASVLARELELAPVDIARIVEQTLRRHADEQPVTLRVHPAEVELAVAAGLPVQPDERLRRGDMTIVLRSGTIDLSLGTRVTALFEA